MGLTGSHNKLNSIYANAANPDLSQLPGDYLVKIMMVPGYGVLNHRKVLYTENGAICGYNILFNRKWGRFKIEKGNAAPPDLLNAAVINYNRSENSCLIRQIRDHVRCVQNDKLYLGRAYYLLFGWTIFLGHFTMEKIKE